MKQCIFPPLLGYRIEVSTGAVRTLSMASFANLTAKERGNFIITCLDSLAFAYGYQDRNMSYTYAYQNYQLIPFQGSTLLISTHCDGCKSSTINSQPVANHTKTLWSVHSSWKCPLLKILYDCQQVNNCSDCRGFNPQR